MCPLADLFIDIRESNTSGSTIFSKKYAPLFYSHGCRDQSKTYHLQRGQRSLIFLKNLPGSLKLVELPFFQNEISFLSVYRIYALFHCFCVSYGSSIVSQIKHKRKIKQWNNNSQWFSFCSFLIHSVIHNGLEQVFSVQYNKTKHFCLKRTEEEKIFWFLYNKNIQTLEKQSIFVVFNHSFHSSLFVHWQHSLPSPFILALPYEEKNRYKCIFENLWIETTLIWFLLWIGIKCKENQFGNRVHRATVQECWGYDPSCHHKSIEWLALFSKVLQDLGEAKGPSRLCLPYQDWGRPEGPSSHHRWRRDWFW